MGQLLALLLSHGCSCHCYNSRLTCGSNETEGKFFDIEELSRAAKNSDN